MTSSFQKFSGLSGILAGLAGLLYLAFFLLFKDPAALLPALALLVVGLLASVTLTGIYQRVRGSDEGFALIGLLFGIAGSLGASVHAAFDLTNNLHPPASLFAYANPVDPRGFLTFAVAGIGTIILSRLILTSQNLPRPVGYLGLVAGILLVLLYIGYLLIFNPLNPLVLGLILISGVLQPIWYLWIGSLLRRGPVMDMRREVSGAMSIPATGERPPDQDSDR